MPSLQVVEYYSIYSCLGMVTIWSGSLTCAFHDRVFFFVVVDDLIFVNLILPPIKIRVVVVGGSLTPSSKSG